MAKGPAAWGVFLQKILILTTTIVRKHDIQKNNSRHTRNSSIPPLNLRKRRSSNKPERPRATRSAQYHMPTVHNYSRQFDGGKFAFQSKRPIGHSLCGQPWNCLIDAFEQRACRIPVRHGLLPTNREIDHFIRGGKSESSLFFQIKA